MGALKANISSSSLCDYSQDSPIKVYMWLLAYVKQPTSSGFLMKLVSKGQSFFSQQETVSHRSSLSLYWRALALRPALRLLLTMATLKAPSKAKGLNVRNLGRIHVFGSLYYLCFWSTSNNNSSNKCHCAFVCLVPEYREQNIVQRNLMVSNEIWIAQLRVLRLHVACS